jgi:ADP-ribose pyrophosphatase YjhB (NUDIX family)
MNGPVLIVSFVAAVALGFLLNRFRVVGWLALVFMLGSALLSLVVPVIYGVKVFDVFALSLVFGFGMSLAEKRSKALKAKADFEAMKTARPQFKHCPSCRSPLAEREIDEKIRLACTHCTYVYWNNPLPVAAAIVPHNSGGIVLVKRGVEPRKGSWCLPAGFMEVGETPEQGAVREAGEEAKIKIEIERLIYTFAPPKTPQVLLFFVAKEIDQTPSPGSDATEARVFQLDELPEDIAFSSHLEAIKRWRTSVGR